MDCNLPSPDFYDDRRNEGEAASALMELYIDEKNKKEKYNEPGCKARGKENAAELQNYINNIRVSK